MLDQDLADNPTSASRRANMRANRSKHTKPEMTIRKLLHGYGYRYSLHRRDLPGKPDLVFPSRSAIIQVHGCFWHQHSGCRLAHYPKTRLAYWQPKLLKTSVRDRLNTERLESLGWRILTIWECELAYPAQALAQAVGFLGPPRLGTTPARQKREPEP